MLTLLRELWSFMLVRKRFWLVPILFMMALLAVLIILTEGSEVVPGLFRYFS
jgi:hypothetical protein